ncbi:hypothetical protein RJ639_008423 [Escallonia herrerae]|uniref:Uncharacterized protein n=1 Tax=Escallonia herrerae TaxID=1293975 RepID=A0AA89ASM0_9ASTE|nr:hypothetical protein RJ639_008423 [Escallonia herrerae]
MASEDTIFIDPGPFDVFHNSSLPSFWPPSISRFLMVRETILHATSAQKKTSISAGAKNTIGDRFALQFAATLFFFGAGGHDTTSDGVDLRSLGGSDDEDGHEREIYPNSDEATGCDNPRVPKLVLGMKFACPRFKSNSSYQKFVLTMESAHDAVSNYESETKFLAYQKQQCLKMLT